MAEAQIENQIINSAIDFILSHLEGGISVDDVAEVCGFSKFYLNRLFKAETGESIYAFIKRLKVEQSAFRLKVEKERSITEIGSDYGYSPSNYATVFSKHFQKNPASFRKEIVEKSVFHPFYHGVKNKIETYEQVCRHITIETLPDFFVLYERRKGDYHNLSSDWCTFTERYKDFITDKTLFLERTFDDPSITKSDSCMYDICLTVDKNDPRLKTQCRLSGGTCGGVSGGISGAGFGAGASAKNADTGTDFMPSTAVIPGGKFAVYHYKGFPQQIYAAYQSFFCRWLSETGNRLDDRSAFDIYRKIDCKSMYMELEICFPIV